MSTCNFTQQIPASQCIGDSLVTINNNFDTLDTNLCLAVNDINLLKAKDDVPVGTIIHANAAPNAKWVRCQNQVLNVSQYSALASILGTKYGGNGSTTFRLPPAHNLKTTNTLSTPFPGAFNCGKATLMQDGRVFYAGQQSSQPYIGTVTGNSVLWQTVTPGLPASRDGANTLTLPDGRILIYAGTNDNTIYGTIAGTSVVGGSWTSANPSTLPLYMSHPVGGYLPDGRLFVVSETTNSLIGTINLATNPISITWVSTTGAPQHKGTGGGGILPDGRIFVTGGGTGAASYIGTVTGNSLNWIEVAPFPTGSYYYLRGGLILPDGRFFSMGGGTESGKECWLGTIIGDGIEWLQGPPDPYGRYLSTSVALQDGRILTFSGRNSPGTFITSFELYAYMKITS